MEKKEHSDLKIALLFLGVVGISVFASVFVTLGITGNATAGQETTGNIWYTGGNVGIGTNNPEAGLDVLSGETIGLRVKSNVDNSYLRVLLEGDKGTVIRAENGNAGNKFLNLQATSSSDSGAFIVLMGNNTDQTGHGEGGVLIETARNSNGGDIIFATTNNAGRRTESMIITQDGELVLSTFRGGGTGYVCANNNGWIYFNKGPCTQ